VMEGGRRPRREGTSSRLLQRSCRGPACIEATPGLRGEFVSPSLALGTEQQGSYEGEALFPSKKIRPREAAKRPMTCRPRSGRTPGGHGWLPLSPRKACLSRGSRPDALPAAAGGVLTPAAAGSAGRGRGSAGEFHEPQLPSQRTGCRGRAPGTPGAARGRQKRVRRYSDEHLYPRERGVRVRFVGVATLLGSWFGRAEVRPAARETRATRATHRVAAAGVCRRSERGRGAGRGPARCGRSTHRAGTRPAHRRAPSWLALGGAMMRFRASLSGFPGRGFRLSGLPVCGVHLCTLSGRPVCQDQFLGGVGGGSWVQDVGFAVRC